MAAERQKLQEALCSYTSDTLAYLATMRDFCERSSDWMLGRERELKIIKDIKERADKEKKLAKELSSVLKKTLGGLKELSCFLDALEKLAVTSLYVFMENQVLHLPEGISLDNVQVVIRAAREVCPLLLEIERDANVFFLPKFQNVGVLSYKLDKYIQTTQKILDKLEKSSFSKFYPKMNMKMVVELNVDLSEGDVQRMFSHIDQLDKIRKDQDFRMVFLFQEEETCSDFISEFNERKPKMLQFLEELEDSCVQMDRMNKGAKISRIVGSSVGAVGGVLSIVGLALIPFKAGASLGLIIGGTVMGVTSGVTSAVTTVTEIAVNRKYQKKASKVFKTFMDDVQGLQIFLKEAFRGIIRKLSRLNLDFYYGNMSEDMHGFAGAAGKADGFAVVAVKVLGIAARASKVLGIAVGAGKVLWKARTIFKGIDVAVDAYSAFKVWKSKDVIAGEGKVVAQEGQALGKMSRVASDVPDVGQAALKGPLALSKSARVGLIAVSTLLVGMDIFYIYKDSISLAKGSETEFSQSIRARAALWSSEIDSWQKIHDSLSRGLPKSEENKAVLDGLFYP